jgi:transglutaminase/protease-like cytokinesis protein 3
LKVDKINLVSAPSLDLFIGETKQMEVEVIPYTATNKNIVWSSNDESVCRVDANGLIFPVSAGEAIITALTKDGGFAVSCEVTVKNNEIITFIDESSKITNTETFDLSTLIVNCNADYKSLVTYQITSGGTYASIEGNILTFNSINKIVEVEIRLDVEGKSFSKKIIMMRND